MTSGFFTAGPDFVMPFVLENNSRSEIDIVGSPASRRMNFKLKNSAKGNYETCDIF
jgi:hypothetical protein